MKPKKTAVFPSKFTFSVIASVAGMLTCAQAADHTWNGSVDGEWNTAGNWTGGVPAGDNAFFANNVNPAINLATAVPIFQLRYDTASVGNFTYGGAQFQASGSGSNITVLATVTNGATITFNNNVQTTTTNRTNPGGFSISAASGSNSNLVFAGNVFASIGTAGIISTVDFKLSNAAGTGSTVVNGLITDSGIGKTGITKTGGGSGTLTLNGANTFSGQTVWNTDSGSLVLGNKAALGTAPVRIAGTNTTNLVSANTPLTGANAVANTLNFLGTSFNNTTNLVLSVTSGTNTGTIVSGTAPKVGDMVTAGVTTFLPANTRITAVSGTTVGSTVTFDLNALATGNTAALTTGPTATNNAVVTVTAGSPTGTLVSGVVPNAGDLVSAGGGAHIPLYTRVLTVTGSGPGAVITFDTNAATTGNTGSLTTVAYTTSSTGAFTVGGTNAIEFSGTQNLSTLYSNGTAATRTYQITNSADTTFSGVLQQLSGTAGLTKTGTGRLILSGANTYTGATTVSAGTLRLAGGAAIADTSAVTLANVATAILDLNDSSETVASIAGGGVTGGNITLGSGTLSVSGSANTTYSGIISGTGGFTRTGSSNTYTNQTLNGASTYSGTTTISNGFLSVGQNSILSATNGPLGNSASPIILGDASTLDTLYNPGAGDGPNVVLLLTGTAATPFSITRDIDSSTTANVKGRTDIGFVGTGTGTLTISSTWTLGSGAQRQHGLYAGLATQTLDFTGLITGGNSAAGLRAGDWGQGVGLVRLSNASNDYTSQTYVSNGTLLIAGDAAAGSGVLGANANLILGDFGGSASALTDGAYAVGKTISLRSITNASNTWTLGGNTANVSSFSGNITPASLAFSPTLRLAQPVGGTVTFSGVIGANPNATNVINLEKTGDGTAVLTNANTYDGVTTVTAGTLLANNTTGSATGAGAVTVASGATLGGTGSIGGVTTINTGGTVAPGASAGTLAVNSDVLIDGTYACQLDGAANGDVLAVTGNLDIDGATLAVSLLGGGASGNYTIATYTGSLTGTFTVSPALPAGYSVDYATPGQIKLVTGAVVTDYHTWATSYSLEDPWVTLGNPALNGNSTGDPDNDGLTNQQEYAFGLVPTSGSSVSPITVQLSKTTGKFTYTRRIPTLPNPDLVFTIETSTTLGGWSLDGTATQNVIGTTGDVQTVEVTLSGSLPLAPDALFVRVVAR